jgi:hypothetical protein
MSLNKKYLSLFRNFQLFIEVKTNVIIENKKHINLCLSMSSCSYPLSPAAPPVTPPSHPHLYPPSASTSHNHRNKLNDALSGLEMVGVYYDGLPPIFLRIALLRSLIALNYPILSLWNHSPEGHTRQPYLTYMYMCNI